MEPNPLDPNEDVPEVLPKDGLEPNIFAFGYLKKKTLVNKKYLIDELNMFKVLYGTFKNKIKMEN